MFIVIALSLQIVHRTLAALIGSTAVLAVLSALNKVRAYSGYVSCVHVAAVYQCIFMLVTICIAFYKCFHLTIIYLFLHTSNL